MNGIPNGRIPFFNIHQVINRIRSSNVRTSADIILPNYISDQRIISGINYENIGYLNGIMSLEPSYPRRFYYKQLVTSANPLITKISIAPWIGFAFQANKLTVIDYLLTHQLDIYQKMITIDYKTLQKDVFHLTLTEGPCIHQIYRILESTAYWDIVHLLKIFLKHGVELTKPIEIRNQVFNQSSVIANEANCYKDIWDYLEIHLRQLPDFMRLERLELLKQIQDDPIKFLEDTINEERLQNSEEVKSKKVQKIVDDIIEESNIEMSKEDYAARQNQPPNEVVFQSGVSELLLDESITPNQQANELADKSNKSELLEIKYH